MPEIYTTEDFAMPIECLTEALDSIKGLYDENRIEDKEKAEQLIDSYKYAIEWIEFLTEWANEVERRNDSTKI